MMKSIATLLVTFSVFVASERFEKYTKDINGRSFAIEHTLTEYGYPLTNRRVFDLMECDSDFQIFFSNVLADVNSGMRFECVGVNTHSLDAVFQFVAVPTSYFDHKRPEATFREYNYGKEKYNVVFNSPRGDSRFISPKPQPGEEPSEWRKYVHLHAYMQGGSLNQLRDFWTKVGHEIKLKLGELNGKNLFISTAGAGVSWLHFRLDERPKYYRHSPYRNAPRAPYNLESYTSWDPVCAPKVIPENPSGPEEVKFIPYKIVDESHNGQKIYTIYINDRYLMTNEQALWAFQNDPKFQDFFTYFLRTFRYSGISLELRPMKQSNGQGPFVFAVHSNRVTTSARADMKMFAPDFADHACKSEIMCTFTHNEANSVFIVPKGHGTKRSMFRKYIDLKLFVKYAPDVQTREFWRLAGVEAQKLVDQGEQVSIWTKQDPAHSKKNMLHLRIDRTNPNDYIHRQWSTV